METITISKDKLDLIIGMSFSFGMTYGVLYNSSTSPNKGKDMLDDLRGKCYDIVKKED